MRRPYIDPSEPTFLRTLGVPGAGSGLRASDAERERAAEGLRRHHADGRLATDEFEERTARVYAARTLGELDQLFTDLPRVRTENDRSRQLLAWPPAMFAPILAALLTIAIVTPGHVVWIVWPIMFFLVFRFARRGYGWGSRG